MTNPGSPVPGSPDDPRAGGLPDQVVQGSRSQSDNSGARSGPPASPVATRDASTALPAGPATGTATPPDVPSAASPVPGERPLLGGLVGIAGRLVVIRWTLVGLLVAAIVAAIAELLEEPSPFELLQTLVVVALALTFYLYHRVVTFEMERRLNRESSVTRILSGLSRSISPESMVDAIVQELRMTSGADHVVVARVRQPDHVVEVTLVSASAVVPASRTYLRPDLIDELASDRSPADGVPGRRDPARPPGSASQQAADEVARRVRSAYGLSNLISSPLVDAGQRRFLGALILSKRTREAWSDADRNLLAWASREVSDAFARAYAHEAAERGANIDSLTGLPNRRYFEELLAIVRPGRRVGDQTGIVMVDVDRFKGINDRYGHATGDIVLRAIAAAITASVRAEDTPARYGGEEFAVLLRRASTGQAADVGERIRATVAALPMERLEIRDPVTVSVGVAVTQEGDADLGSVVDRADRALYVAKRRGRDRVETA